MPAVARGTKRDSVLTGHLCDTTTTTDVCSTSVFVNNKGACRKDDAISLHTIQVGNSCVDHTATITAGSSTVFVDGFAIARNGDAADSGTISSGSDDVFAGG